MPLSGTVLIVEDDDTTRTAMSRLLRHAGVTVELASSVAEAVAKLTAAPQSLACVLVDVLLPDGSGVTVVEAVRAARLPAKVAILTGSVEPDLARRVKADCGADAIFLKPVDALEVLGWVEGCCSRRDH